MKEPSLSLEQCCGCGLCAGVCPTNALTMRMEKGRYLPFFSAKECNGCRRCEKVCDDSPLKESFPQIEKSGNNFHPFLGYYLKCYTGFSTTSDIRKKAASGGLISALLIKLLNSGEIDGAIVTKLIYKGQYIETYPFIARTEKDILSASGSYYLPVNFSNVIKEIQNQKSNEVYAIVGLPCVISKLKNAKANFTFLDEKIKYMFGLFCSHNFNYSVLDFIKNKAEFPPGSNIRSFNFRSKWPESVILMQTLEKEYKLDPKYWNFLFTLKMYSMSNKCLECCDFCGEFADISFGDAWLPSIKKVDKIGTSICISKTKKGEKLLAFAANTMFISLFPISSADVVDSQRFALYFKKIQTPWLQKLLRKEGSDYRTNNARFIPQLLITIPLTFSIRWLSNKYPLSMERIPHIIYKIFFYMVSLNVVTGYAFTKGRQK